MLASYLLSLRINFSVNKTDVIIFPLKGFEGLKKDSIFENVMIIVTEG